MKKLIFTLVAFVLFLFLFFITGEICFRVFRGSPNPLEEITQLNKVALGKPNSKVHVVDEARGEFDYMAYFNKYGYRSADFLMPKPKGMYRIFVVGDSFTHGVGAENNETIPALIEKNLHKKFPAKQIEVVNAGVGHTSPLLHYLNLRNIHLNYDPDLVLLLLDLTDLRDDWQRARNIVYDKNGDIKGFNPMYEDGRRNWWITCVYYSSFCRWIHDKIVRSFDKIRLLGFRKYISAAIKGKHAKGLIAIDDHIKTEKDIMQYDNLILARGLEKKEIIDKYFKEYTAQYLLKIKKLLDDKGIPFVIGMYPYGHMVSKTAWSEGRKVWGFEPGKIYDDYYAFEVVRNFTMKENIFFINSLNGFLREKNKDALFFDFDGHLTPKGNAIVAQAVSESPGFLGIVQKGLK